MRFLPAFLLLSALASAAPAPPLPGTQSLSTDADLSADMVSGITRWLGAETLKVRDERSARWHEAAAKPWEPFAEAERAKLREIIGAVDRRVSGPLEMVRPAGGTSGPLPEHPAFRFETVHWPVLEGVQGEGVFLLPPQPRAVIIVLPDPDSVSAQVAAAAQLAAQGCAVLIPTLLDRQPTWSGSDAMKRSTNEPHREWIYRQAFILGRTPIGYEVQKVIGAIDALLDKGSRLELEGKKIAVVGYGEGGLIGLYAAALEPRISATLISGYFGSHQALYHEPIYRNQFGILRDFDNAELAALIQPRQLIVEYSRTPAVAGPPAPSKDHSATAAPGVIETPPFTEVEAEVNRAREILPAKASPEAITLLAGKDGKALPAISPEAVAELFRALDLEMTPHQHELPPAKADEIAAILSGQQHRTVLALQQFTQRLIPAEERERTQMVWNSLKPGPEWDKSQAELRARLWQSIGRISPDRLPPNPRTRVAVENPKWAAYDVVLDVQTDLYAWGWLLVPKDLPPGERRPVVVCQHGLEGLPEDTVSDDPKGRGFHFYNAFAARLCEQGFIVYSPHNPYRGEDRFREINRRANPLALSLYSFIVAQHEVTTDWLASLPFVDPERIGFYGLSYGGKTAMRVPALVPRYCLSICSGDFNEWVRKIASDEYRNSYIFSHEYEISEWNLGHNANYAEMALLIAPRPFMVERGHDDAVGTDDWIGYEYAKVLRGYTKLGIPERTAIEWFDGPHTIHGQGTFEFLHTHLRWPPKP